MRREGRGIVEIVSYQRRRATEEQMTNDEPAAARDRLNPLPRPPLAESSTADQNRLDLKLAMKLAEDAARRGSCSQAASSWSAANPGRTDTDTLTAGCRARKATTLIFLLSLLSHSSI